MGKTAIDAWRRLQTALYMRPTDATSLKDPERESILTYGDRMKAYTDAVAKVQDCSRGTLAADPRTTAEIIAEETQRNLTIIKAEKTAYQLHSAQER